MRRGFQSHPMVIRCRSSDSGSPEPSPSPNACPNSESNALRHAMNALALPAPPALQPDAVRLLGECARLQKLGGGRFSELVNADIGREQTCSARSFCMFFYLSLDALPTFAGMRADCGTKTTFRWTGRLPLTLCKPCIAKSSPLQLGTMQSLNGLCLNRAARGFVRHFNPVLSNTGDQ
jgi:hypothetical protein